MSRYYVAGPMTSIALWNYPAFFEAARQLEKMGHDVENPADNDGPDLESSLRGAFAAKRAGKTWGDYMRLDMPRIAVCDGMVVLPGWQKSRGATLEVELATRLGMPIMCLREWCVDPITAPELTVTKLVPRVRAVGLSGYARSGKDTVGAQLVERGYLRVSFADKLREMALALDPIVEAFRDQNGITQIVNLSTEIEWSGWEGTKDRVPEVRRLLQALGTDAGRKILGENVWVDLAFRDIPDGARVVFTDVRFPNEAKAIRDIGGQLWRITRPGFEPVNAHESETALDDYKFDFYIDNSTDLPGLAYDVDVLAAAL